MYNRRTKKLPQIIIGQFGVALLITLMASSILFYAMGYRFNYRSFKIVKTGILSVVTYPKVSTVRLNGKVKGDKTPWSMNLTAGYYSVDVDKEGYLPWSISTKIEPELVSNFKNVVLIKEKPEISDLKDAKKIDLLNTPDNIMALKNGLLAYNNYEIWYDGKLVTRFSQPIDHAVMYPDGYHVIFQQGDQISMIEITGTNETPLVKLSSDTVTNFVCNNKGTELYYNDNGQYKMAVIREL